MEISFYQLKTTPIDKALPKLLEKAYDAGHRVHVVANAAEMKKFDDSLWTFHPQKFLPHGTTEPSVQPIFLASDSENKNNATILAVTNGSKIPDVSHFVKVLDIFDGNIEPQLQSARERWKLYKAAGYVLKYWLQDDKGNWAEKSA